MRYGSLDGARAELDAFARALGRQTQRFAETFVTAVSPGFAACSLENQHYDTHEAYVFALARELKQEYQFIVSQGQVLQIDSPDLGIERAGYFQDEPLAKFIEAMEMHGELGAEPAASFVPVEIEAPAPPAAPAQMRDRACARRVVGRA